MSWAAPKTRTRGPEQKRSVGGIKKNPTWAPKCPKIGGKSDPADSKNAPKLLLGRSWGALGALGRLLVSLGALFGRSLGALGAFLGARGAVLGRSLDVLERSWGSFWAPGALLLELFWSPLRAGLQYHKNIENHWFFNGFSRFFRVRGSQNRPKIIPKRLLDTRLAPRGGQK